jgi:SAM-dependent methyltransferase
MYKAYIILDILKEKYGTLNKLRKCDVLEIGCGNGRDSKFFCNFSKTYIATDKSKAKINEAENLKHPLYENLTFMVNDIVESKITNKFNIIIAINVIHFTGNKINIAFDNMMKCLKKDGIIIITEPHIKPVNWGDESLNKKSDKFDKSMWNRKKKELKDEHNYIINLPNITYDEYESCRVYIVCKT